MEEDTYSHQIVHESVRDQGIVYASGMYFMGNLINMSSRFMA